MVRLTVSFDPPPSRSVFCDFFLVFLWPYIMIMCSEPDFTKKIQFSCNYWHPQFLLLKLLPSGWSFVVVVVIIVVVANDHLEDPASCNWSSGVSSLSQLIIWRIRPLATDHLEDPASCQWSFRGSSLLLLIIRMIQPLANYHPKEPASCNWSSRRSGLLQIIIWRDWPLANDHHADPASFK